MSDGRELGTRVAAQCATDILIQVYDENNPEASAIFAFKLGNCLADWVDDVGRVDGVVVLSEKERLILLRAAAHLERHAQMIRDTLLGPIEEPTDDPNAPATFKGVLENVRRLQAETKMPPG